MRKKKTRLFLTVILIVLTALFWYKHPYKIEKKCLASKLDGTTINMTIELKAYRNFSSPTHYEGIITINEEVYRTLEAQGGAGFIERFKNKAKGIEDYPFLLREDRSGHFVNNHDLLDIMWASSGFKELHFALVNKNNGEYFAPAAGSLEAKELQEKIAERMGAKSNARTEE